MRRFVPTGASAALALTATLAAQPAANRPRADVGSISGRVVDTSGAPVPAVNVETRRWSSSGRAPALIAGGNKTTTDEHGRFQLTGIVPGAYAIEAAPEVEPFPDRAVRRTSGLGITYYPNATTPEEAQLVEVAANRATDAIDISMTRVRLSTLSGRVFDADGNPRGRADVRATRDDEMLSCGRLVASHADGTFTIPNLPPGRYRLEAAMAPRRRGAFEETRLTLIVNEADVENVTLMAMRYETISGHIRFDDPRAARSVKPSAIQLMSALANPDGEPHTSPLAHVRDDFSFDVEVPRGPIVFRVFTTGWRLAHVVTHGQDVTESGIDLDRAAPPADLQVELTNGDPALSGVAHDSSGALAPHAAILVFPDDRTKWRAPLDEDLRWGLSDEAGRFEMGTLRPGDYLIAAFDRAAADWHDPVLLEALRPYATRITLRERTSDSVDLRVALLPGWVAPSAGPSYGAVGSLLCGGP